MRLLRRICLLAILLATVCAVAQSQGTKTSPKQKPQAPATQNARPADQVPEGVQQPLDGEQQPAPVGPIRSAQRQLAQTSEEAAGEGKDENQEFKESPSVAWFARHTGLGLRAAYWVLIIINFVIIIALIVWGWKKNVPAMFRSRTEAIRKNLEEARRASEEANRRLSEIEARLSRLDAEIADMRKHAEDEAAAEEVRIKAAAEEDRRKVVESAEQEIDAAAKAARRDLKAYAATLAVSLAEKKIHVDRDTDQALVNRFVRELAGNGGKDGR